MLPVTVNTVSEQDSRVREIKGFGLVWGCFRDTRGTRLERFGHDCVEVGRYENMADFQRFRESFLIREKKVR